MRNIIVTGPILSTLCSNIMEAVKPDERITEIDLHSSCTREGLEAHLITVEVKEQEVETRRELIPITCAPYKLAEMVAANTTKLDEVFLLRPQILSPGSGVPRVVAILYKESLVDTE